MTQTQPWMMLKDGAAKVAAQRLSDTHQLITTAIVQFHEDAVTQIEGFEDVNSEEGLGLELFKALTDVLMVAFPEEMIIEKVAAEAIKGFRDVMIAGVQQQEKATAAQTLAHAKDQLRHVLDDLVAGFRASAQDGWSAGHYKIDDSLNAFFEAHPNYKNLEYGADANQYEEWICDQIGIKDPPSFNPSHTIIEALWAKFNHEVARVSWNLQNHHRPVIERMGFDYAHWLTLDARGRLEELGKLHGDERSHMLHEGGFNNMMEDHIKAWLNLAELWDNPATREAAVADAEMMMLAG